MKHCDTCTCDNAKDHDGRNKHLPKCQGVDCTRPAAFIVDKHAFCYQHAFPAKPRTAA